MSLGLNTTEQEVHEDSKRRKNNGFLKYMLAVGVVIIAGGAIWGYFSYSDSLERKLEQNRENDRLTYYRTSGIAIMATVKNVSSLTRGPEMLGFEAEYEFTVNEETFAGKGGLEGSPELERQFRSGFPFGYFDDIRVYYDPKDPSQSITSADLTGRAKVIGDSGDTSWQISTKGIVSIIILVIFAMVSFVKFIFR